MDTPPTFRSDFEPDAVVPEFKCEHAPVGGDNGAAETTLTVAEAACRLGVSRARVYQLVASGALDAEGAAGSVRIAAASVHRRRVMSPRAGAQLAPLSAWAILALASDDPPLLKQVAGLLSDPDRSRARSRLQHLGLLSLVPRLRGRAVERRFVVPAERLGELLADVRVVLGGTSAARQLGWALPDGPWPVEAYVLETELVPILEQYALECEDQSVDLVLRTVQEPWPFAAHVRVVPAVVAALDLAEASDGRLAELGTRQLAELATQVVADWRQRPPRRQPVRPIIPTGPPAHTKRRPPPIDDLVWDDRAEQDANQLVALLFVAATPLR